MIDLIEKRDQIGYLIVGDKISIEVVINDETALLVTNWSADAFDYKTATYIDTAVSNPNIQGVVMSQSLVPYKGELQGLSFLKGAGPMQTL